MISIINRQENVPHVTNFNETTHNPDKLLFIGIFIKFDVFVQK